MTGMVHIGDRCIGPGAPCYLIAEAGVNHNGEMDLAYRLIDAAVDAGVDAVKFQSFKTERIVTQTARKAAYQLRTTDAGESQYDMLRRLELSVDDHRALVDYCREKGITFLSTPTDEESAALLHELGVPAFKVSSCDVTNLPFLTRLAHFNKPILLSTGMSTLGEVDEAVRTLRRAGNDQLALLQCVTNYPADPADANLYAMHTMEMAFQTPVGFSDHIPGHAVALAAVALGATLYERHFTLDRTLPGPDHKASSEPRELAELVRDIRVVEAALGNGRKEPAPSEIDIAAAARKSLVAADDLPAGTVLTPAHIAIKRPGTGLSPALLPLLMGKTVNAIIPKDTILSLDMLV